MEFGYFLSTEEYTPQQLLEQAVLAEEAGFDKLWVSDHFHPWNDEQGQSPFVWSLIGAISQVCGLHVTTAVTCPTVRTHPAIIAQAAATSAVLLDGRFTLGVGSGEALNEHILGGPWPTTDVRLEMLEESVEVIRKLWKGEVVNHRGRHYTVDTARIYTLPEQTPEIYLSGFGPKATELAGRIADGYISTMPDSELLGRFRDSGGQGKTAQVGFKVCYAETEDAGGAIAHRIWPNSGVPGELSQVLPSPKHFEQAAELVTQEMIQDKVACGPDAEAHLAAYEPFLEAGYDEVYVANMGPHYREMIALHGELLPRLRERTAAV